MLQFVGVTVSTVKFFGSGLVEKSFSSFHFLHRATSLGSTTLRAELFSWPNSQRPKTNCSWRLLAERSCGNFLPWVVCSWSLLLLSRSKHGRAVYFSRPQRSFQLESTWLPYKEIFSWGRTCLELTLPTFAIEGVDSPNEIFHHLEKLWVLKPRPAGHVEDISNLRRGPNGRLAGLAGI